MEYNKENELILLLFYGGKPLLAYYTRLRGLNSCAEKYKTEPGSEPMQYGVKRADKKWVVKEEARTRDDQHDSSPDALSDWATSLFHYTQTLSNEISGSGN